MIERARLLALWDQKHTPPLCLVRAPAGYGKTALLSQWRAAAQARGTLTLWLTLSRADSDPSNLVARLHQIVTDAARIGASSLGEGTHKPAVDMSGIAQVVASLPPFVLFLDELEKVRSDASQRLIERLLESVPLSSSIVIASREMPRFPIAALRVRGRLLEIGTEDLRFNRTEVAAVLQARDVSVEPATLDEVVVRTEGWAAAIRLVALALDECADPHEFVRGLTGSRRDVADFLAEEVLLRQPDDLQRFLMVTSVLDRMAAPICNLLTGREDSQKVLEHLYREGMFVFAVDDSRKWYRYHPLFAEFLRDRLSIEEPALIAPLHRIAALWHLEKGDFTEAVDHALRSSDVQLAASLIARVARETFFRGRMTTVAHWADQLPCEMLDAHPEIREAAAWANACLPQPEKAREHVSALAALALRQPLPAVCRDTVLTIEPVLLIYEDRDEEAYALSKQAIGKLSGEDPFCLAAHDHVLAVGRIAESDFDAARSVLIAARARHGQAGSLFGSVYSVSLLGLCEAVQGKLQQAKARYQEAEALARSGEQAALYKSIVGAYLAEILYEQNDLDGAELLLTAAFETLTETVIGDMSAIAFLTMARVHAARGAIDYAHRTLDDAEAHAIRNRFPRLTQYAQWERVRLALQARRLDLANRFRSRLPAPAAGTLSYFHHAGECEAADIGEIRFQIASGSGRSVLPLIRALIAQSKELGRGWRTLRLMVMEVLALHATGERTTALRLLLEALQAGAAHGFIRSFADESAGLAPLLHAIADTHRSPAALAEAGLPPGYLERVLLACGLNPLPRLRAGDGETLEALSDRERKILEMVARGLSNRELAQRLFVSEHTVKWHLLRIFQKLGVHSRSKAVAIARSGGLID